MVIGHEHYPDHDLYNHFWCFISFFLLYFRFAFSDCFSFCFFLYLNLDNANIIPESRYSMPASFLNCNIRGELSKYSLLLI
jgi:hypothetical protein